MRVRLLAAACLACLATSVVAAPPVAAEGGATPSDKPWCGRNVTLLSDHVCYVDGGPDSAGRRTLVIYLHGVLAKTPGFQYVQQRWMANEARSHAFTLLLPTAPAGRNTDPWPTSERALREQEVGILAGIQQARADLEKRVGARFDETFVVGFSSGGYYASSLAARRAIDVDGYIVLAGGGASIKKGDDPAGRAPIFIGVSAADRSSAPHSLALAGTLRRAHWPMRIESRNTGHGVDRAFMAHGLSWLRGLASTRPSNAVVALRP